MVLYRSRSFVLLGVRIRRPWVFSGGILFVGKWCRCSLFESDFYLGFLGLLWGALHLKFSESVFFDLSDEFFCIVLWEGLYGDVEFLNCFFVRAALIDGEVDGTGSVFIFLQEVFGGQGAGGVFAEADSFLSELVEEGVSVFVFCSEGGLKVSWVGVGEVSALS